jgi:cell division protein FtsZ
MENEVRITLIATGFQSKMGMGRNAEEDEINKILKNMKTEEELDMPSFLRRPLFSHRRTAGPQSEYSMETVKQRHFQ